MSVSAVQIAEYVFRLLPEEEEERIHRRIAADSALAREEALWIDVVGSMIEVRPHPDTDGPVPDVLPAVNARLFGTPAPVRRIPPRVLGLGLAIVLVAKAYVLKVIWQGL